MPKHALIYIRKFVVRTGSDTVSPERQRDACMDEAERHGWVVEPADIYTDAEGHMSGRDDQRPAWLAMQRRLAHDPDVAAVIVESLSRASRSVRSFFAFVDEMRCRQVALISLKERFDTSNAIGQAMLGFIAIVNQLESDLASERMTGQIKFKRERGRHWGRTPFGCDREPVTGALVPSTRTYHQGRDRLYHDALRRCYELYSTGEYSLGALATALNAEDWRFRGVDGHPRRWDRSSVLLLHPIYAGRVPLQGHAKDSPTEWVQANCAPVLPPDLCERVEAALLRRSQTQRKPTPPARSEHPVTEYALTGVLHCAECGRSLKGYRYHYGDRYRVYRHESRGACSQSWSRADLLEAQAFDLLTQMLVPTDATGALIEDLLGHYGDSAHEEIAAELAETTRALAKTEAEVQRLVELAISSPIDQGVYQRVFAERSAELAALHDRERELAEP